MGTKSREVIWGSQIRGAKMSGEKARQRATEAAREADRAEAHAWSVRMEGYGGPATISDDRPMPQRRPGLARGGVQPLQTRASLPLNAIRRPRDTSICKLEAALKSWSCRKGRYAPPVHMVKLIATQAITPYKSVHPDAER